ncbi:hypothetical protein LARI1_G004462 [Lachnellula arida]|uniref:Uncharacterized protein n=1 Tax=Lachnellula arida TaxID=1316785 RepID=A0A8T9BAA6_9HELO|nr:hypothetical protein LARI1_G004462 [Lachnellula arida]
MSTPATHGPDVPPAKSKRLSTFVTRIKTVLKRSDGSKRLSFSRPAAATSTAGPSAVKSDEPAADPTNEEPTQLEIPKEEEAPTEPQAKKVNRAQIDAERARKLGERFKIAIDPVIWPTEEVYRVEKPIRMRIHRQCHRCRTTFGGSKTCNSCHHVRCTKCPRYPPRKTDKDRTEKAPATSGGLEVDNYYGLREVVEIRKPNPRPGGQPLVRKKPMQRIRRTCHECSTLFVGNAKVCSSCNHVRCADCPRDPAKKRRYPDGYPGDAPSSNTSLPVKYACHRCTKVFPPIPHPDSGLEQPKQDCVRCHHERCSECRRAPPRRIEPEPDPELLKRVEAKLAALHVGTTTATVTVTA